MSTDSFILAQCCKCCLPRSGDVSFKFTRTSFFPDSLEMSLQMYHVIKDSRRQALNFPAPQLSSGAFPLEKSAYYMGFWTALQIVTVFSPCQVLITCSSCSINTGFLTGVSAPGSSVLYSCGIFIIQPGVEKQWKYRMVCTFWPCL